MILDYEQWALDGAIDKLQELRAKAKAGTSADDFYSTMFEVLNGLNSAIQATNAIRQSHRQLAARVDILERLLLLHLPPTDLITHHILDKLKNK